MRVVLSERFVKIWKNMKVIYRDINNMIRVRKHIRGDIKYRVKRLNDSEVNKFIGDNLGVWTTTKKQQEWFDDYEKSRNKKFFTICDGDKPIWWMWLSNINKQNRNADLFLAIWESNYRWRWIWKSSILWLIKYGFEKLKLHKINLGVVEKNTSAVNLYKSVGFEIEWRMKDEVFSKWNFYSFLSMAIFNKDW